MSLSEQLDKEYVTAYKAKDATRLTVLRLLKTAMKNRLVELKRPGGSLDDAEVMDVIIRETKQRKDSIQQYTDAGRPDLAEKENAELLILQGYLPKALDNDELINIVKETIAETGASSPRDMGKVISSIMARYKGQVDGKQLSETVKQHLAG